MIDDDRITLTDSTQAAMERIATAPATAARAALGQPGLSPAAQAVWDAAWNLSPVNCESHEDRRRQQIAAALRAAADQVVPQEKGSPRRGMRPGGTGALSPDEGAEDQRAAIRRRILAIATELERQPDV